MCSVCMGAFLALGGCREGRAGDDAPASSGDAAPASSGDVAETAGSGLATTTAAPDGGASGESDASSESESPIDCADLPSHITADGMRAHLEALESIATANGNRRSVGTVGYDQSVDYMREQLEAAGYVVTTHELDVEVAGEMRHTASVLAETPSGDPDDVIILGAHLDSVPSGPGINDNGTGVAALLEIARAIHGCATTRRVRFAWWGAEEVMLAGSTAYVASLDAAERDAITTYMNFDMIGSPNYVRFVYDGDGSAFAEAGPPGSAELEHAFSDYFESVGSATEEIAFGGRSDYVAFLESGIGVGGLFTGANSVKSEAEAQVYGGRAGVAYDACYHEPCDGVDNVDLGVLESMARAIAHAVELLAM